MNDLATINEENLLEPAPAPVPAAAPMTPTERIQANEKMLSAIGPVIKRDHTIKQNGTLYVRYAGGVAIANSLGYTISTSKPVFVDNAEGQYYECTAYLLDNGRVVAEAVGYLGMDERRWADEPIYSKRSMAQTRAAARLCRQNFAHFYIGIGASDTAWEEMPQQPKPKTTSQTIKRVTSSLSPSSSSSGSPEPSGDPEEGGEYVPTGCELKRSGEGNNGTWQIHTVTTECGFKFDSFNVEPDDIQDAIGNKWKIRVKGLKQTQYGWDAKYIDPVKPANAEKVVTEEPAQPIDEEMPF